MTRFADRRHAGQEKRQELPRRVQRTSPGTPRTQGRTSRRAPGFPSGQLRGLVRLVLQLSWQLRRLSQVVAQAFALLSQELKELGRVVLVVPLLQEFDQIVARQEASLRDLTDEEECR